MSDVKIYPGENLSDLINQVKSLTEGTTGDISVLANISSLLYWSVRDLNWVGFYLSQDETLYLGPFHGKPACVVIPFGRGVCGAAAVQRSTIVVPNVGAYPGHIACDADSRSEIVVPLISDDGRLLGVLDVDSPITERFGKEEQEFFEAVVATLLSGLKSAVPLRLAFVP